MLEPVRRIIAVTLQKPVVETCELDSSGMFTHTNTVKTHKQKFIRLYNHLDEDVENEFTETPPPSQTEDMAQQAPVLAQPPVQYHTPAVARTSTLQP